MCFIELEAFSLRHGVEDRLHVTGPDIASPKISAERFNLPPQSLIAAERRGPSALLYREVDGFHKRHERNRGFWHQSWRIDFRKKVFGLRARLFLGHVIYSAHLH